MVDFKNTLIILTSNLGSQALSQLPEGANAEAARDQVMAAVRAHFRPEFLNRLDEIVVFDRLTRKNMDGIVDIQLGLLAGRLAARDITLEVDEAARTWLANRGYDPVYGARPLKRVIQKELQDKLASRLLAGEIRDGAVGAGDGRRTGRSWSAPRRRSRRRRWCTDAGAAAGTAARPPGQDGGRMTPSTTWMMPFEAITSGCTTLTPPTLRPLKPSTMMLRPLRVTSVVVLLTSDGGGVAARHHVQLQDARELVAVLRHEQPLELVLGQLREGGVARREDGEGAGLAERLHVGVGQRLRQRREAGVGVEDVANRRARGRLRRAGGHQGSGARCEREADECPAVHHCAFLPAGWSGRPSRRRGQVTRDRVPHQ